MTWWCYLFAYTIQHVPAEKQHFDKWACAEPWTCPFKWNFFGIAFKCKVSLLHLCFLVLTRVDEQWVQDCKTLSPRMHHWYRRHETNLLPANQKWLRYYYNHLIFTWVFVWKKSKKKLGIKNFIDKKWRTELVASE